MTPTTEPAKRIAALFRRRLTTHWSDKEVKTYRQLVKRGCFEPLDDLELIERYYAAERRKGERGMHRRDLCTFVNNFTGELDRANEWNRTHPKERKIIPMPPAAASTQPEVICDDVVRQRFLAEYEERKRRGA